MPIFPPLRHAALLVTGTLLGLLVVLQGQEPSVARMVTAEVPYAAVDRGMRPADSPVEPRHGINREASSRGRRFLADSVIVKFRDSVSTNARATALSGVHASSSLTPSWADFSIVTLTAGENPETAATTLAARADVEYAQPRYRVRPLFVPNDPLYARQWNFTALDMERAWDLNAGASSSVIVAVLDTGIAYRNASVTFVADRFVMPGFGSFPALGRVTIPFAASPELGPADRFVAPVDMIWGDNSPLDLDGHGTHVAGTIGQLTNNAVGTAGMAFNVRLMPVKVIDSDWDAVFGSPYEATDDVVARGIRYAADNGAKVINLSIGRDGGPAPAIRSAIEYAVQRGAFVVAAGGNEFEDGNPVNRLAEFAREINGMVAVGAIGPDRTRAFYSNVAPYIELVAPGGNSRSGGSNTGILQQTYDPDQVDRFARGPSRYGPPRFDIFAYDSYQGTSMATPHVSGFAALLIQQGISNPAAIEAVMERYATDLGTPGRDNEYGYGLINPRASLRGMGLIR